MTNLARKICYKSANFLIGHGFNVRGKNLVIPYTVDDIRLIDLLKENGANVRLEPTSEFLYNFDFEYEDVFNEILARTVQHENPKFEYYYDDIFNFIFAKINDGYIILCMINEDNEIIDLTSNEDARKISTLYDMPILQIPKIFKI